MTFNTTLIPGQDSSVLGENSGREIHYRCHPAQQCGRVDR